MVFLFIVYLNNNDLKFKSHGNILTQGHFDFRWRHESLNESSVSPVLIQTYSHELRPYSRLSSLTIFLEHSYLIKLTSLQLFFAYVSMIEWQRNFDIVINNPRVLRNPMKMIVFLLKFFLLTNLISRGS